jgi:UDP-GlcNAc:undecaprenyl-phosphate/decaprenyl-phosphate GlcNAc-1-phosphate transferase
MKFPVDLSLLAPIPLALLLAGLLLLGMPVVARALRLERRNFAGETLFTGYGLVVWVPTAVALGWLAGRGVPGAAPGVTALVVFGLVGLADDRWGDRSAGGFRGHLRQLVERGRVTTGVVKLAVGGGAALVLGLWLAGDAAPPFLRVLLEPAAPSTDALPPLPELAPLPPPGWVGVLDFLTAAAVIALSANALNLLDLRPLRALKGFWLSSLLLLIVSVLPLAVLWLPFPPAWGAAFERLPPWVRESLAVAPYPRGLWRTVALLAPAWAASALYAPLEARRRAMLGDTGSNPLGALLGVAACVLLPVAGQTVLALFLAALNLYAESHSLSALIRARPLLRRLDRWGNGRVDGEW